MPSLTTINDLNKLASDEKLIVLLEVEIPSTSTLYLANYNANVTFLGNEYQAFLFNMGEITSGKGEVPQFEIKIDNTSRGINSLMMDYDIYLKANGIEGNQIYANIIVVNTVDLSDYVLKERFELVSWDMDSKFASFKLGASNPFTQKYPLRAIYSSICQWKFKSSQCGYSGSATTCDKTLVRCRELGNSARIGAFPGVQS